MKLKKSYLNMKLKFLLLLSALFIGFIAKGQFRKNWGGLAPTIDYTGRLGKRVDINFHYFTGHRIIDLDRFTISTGRRFLTLYCEQTVKVKLGEKFSLGAGYVAQSYLPLSLFIYQVDRRVFLEGEYKTDIEQTKLQQRVRFENSNLNIGGGIFTPNNIKFHYYRVRYRVGVTMPVSEKIYFRAYEEPIFSISENIKHNSFAENWLYFGFGKTTQKRNRWELGLFGMSWLQAAGQWSNMYNIQIAWVHTPKSN